MAEAARWLTREEAARRVKLSVLAFTRDVAAGKLPPPSNRLGPRKLRWDLHALDAAMLGGVASAREAPDLATILEQESRARRPAQAR